MNTNNRRSRGLIAGVVDSTSRGTSDLIKNSDLSSEKFFFQSILPLQLRAFSVEWFTFWKLDSCQIFINSAMRFPYQLLLSQIHRSFGQMQNTLTSPRCSGSQDLKVDKGYIYVTWLFLVHWLLNRPKLALKKAWSLYHLWYHFLSILQCLITWRA